MYGKRDLVLSRKQIIHELPESKGGLLALKEFQDLCSSKIMLIATDKTAFVVHTKKKQEVGAHCAPYCGEYRLCAPGNRNVVGIKPS